VLPKQEILKLMERLDIEPAESIESEELEFKPWSTEIKENQRVAREYAVCFANAKGGTIVFGVRDKTVGRSAAIHGCKDYNTTTFTTAIYQGTSPNIAVHIEEAVVREGTLLLVQVPPGRDDTTYATSDGLHKIRIDKTCQPLFQSNHRRLRMSIGAIDWSAEPAEGVSIQDLDPIEIERFRNTLRVEKPSSDLLALSHEELLRAIGAVESATVVNAGVLMFARKDILRKALRQHEVIFVSHTSPTEIFKENLSAPILAILERMTEILLLPIYNPTRSLQVDMFNFDVQKFPTMTLREALLNAIVHRDYTQPGQVYVRLENDDLCFSNPGGFIGGITVDNILTHEAKQRNKRLAEMVEKSGLVERAGIGRRRIFIPMLAFGKRMPTYDADAHTVALHLYGGVVSDKLALLVARLQKDGYRLGINELAVLNYLVTRESIDATEASSLLQVDPPTATLILDDLMSTPLRMLEKRGKKKGVTYHLERAIAVDLLGRSKYAQMKDIEAVRFPEMIRQYVEEHGSISNRECRELLRLGNSASASVKSSQILSQLIGPDGFLRAVGKSKAQRRYVLKQIK